MTSRILAVATAVPDHPFDQERAIRVIERWYDSVYSIEEGGAEEPDAAMLDKEKALSVMRNAGAETRYSAIPVEELLPDRPLGSKNRDYIRVARELGEKVVRDVLAQQNLSASAVDMIITVSCTGFMIPSLDAYLLNRFDFRRDVNRLPITELGCAAGVASLRLADDFLKAHPDAVVLVVAVELATLTFQPSDFSADHVVSCAIFGDGAAAMLVTGKPGAGWTIEKTGTCFFPGTVDFMGFDLEATGFHIFLSPRIPRFIRDDLIPAVKEILREGPRIDRWLVHPGGPKILDAMEDALGLPRDGLIHSRDILRRYGNLSSVTIFFIMEACLENSEMLQDERQGILAVGPGFQLDYAVTQWRGK